MMKHIICMKKKSANIGWCIICHPIHMKKVTHLFPSFQHETTSRRTEALPRSWTNAGSPLLTSKLGTMPTYVEGKHLHTTNSSNKLSEKFHGPYKIIACPGILTQLPCGFQIISRLFIQYFIFHSWKKTLLRQLLIIFKLCLLQTL